MRGVTGPADLAGASGGRRSCRQESDSPENRNEAEDVVQSIYGRNGGAPGPESPDPQEAAGQPSPMAPAEPDVWKPPWLHGSQAHPAGSADGELTPAAWTGEPAPGAHTGEPAPGTWTGEPAPGTWTGEPAPPYWTGEAPPDDVLGSGAVNGMRGYAPGYAPPGMPGRDEDLGTAPAGFGQAPAPLAPGGYGAGSAAGGPAAPYGAPPGYDLGPDAQPRSFDGPSAMPYHVAAAGPLAAPGTAQVPPTAPMWPPPPPGTGPAPGGPGGKRTSRQPRPGSRPRNTQ